jgi:hypothetical protein
VDLFEFLYPQQAQAANLRRLADATARQAGNAAGTSAQVEELARENRELRLYLTALTQLLVEKGLLQPADLQARVLALLPPVPAPVGDAESDNPFADLGR